MSLLLQKAKYEFKERSLSHFLCSEQNCIKNILEKCVYLKENVQPVYQPGGDIYNYNDVIYLWNDNNVFYVCK